MENTMIHAPENLDLNVSNSETFYCSLKGGSQKDKAVLYKAMANPEKRLADFIGSTILAKDLYMEQVAMTNEETGEKVNTPRIVIIDKDGISYQCVSFGVFNALKRVIAVFGEPTWKEPLPLTVKQTTKGQKKMLTLDVNF